MASCKQVGSGFVSLLFQSLEYYMPYNRSYISFDIFLSGVCVCVCVCVMDFAWQSLAIVFNLLVKSKLFMQPFFLLMRGMGGGGGGA